MERMTKSYSVFDCDAHINDYPFQWQKHFSEGEKELVKSWYWHFGQYVMMNGRTGYGRPVDRWFVMPGQRNAAGAERASFVDFLGPGMNKETIRKLDRMPLTTEQLEELAFKGSIEPLPRLRDMDLMGIDQVLVIPIGLLTSVQWVGNAIAAATVVRAYNNWVKYDYCDAAPDRLFPCGVLAPQSPHMAVEELYRVARLGFPVALVRPIDALGTYPSHPMFDPLWRAFEETGVVCGVHTVAGAGGGMWQETLATAGQLAGRAISGRQVGAGEALGFIHEAMHWVAGMLLSGFLERYPKLKMAVFESNATWLPMLLEACDRLYHLYGSQRLPKVQALPSETFRERCLIAFESDEEWMFRRHRYYENMGIWSSDAYHHDGADAWEAIELMRKLEVPEETQAKLMGGNARRFYGLEGKAKLYTTQTAGAGEIQRPEWFPKAEEIEAFTAASRGVSAPR